MSATEPQPAVLKPRHRWFRYCLWTLLLLVTVLLLALGQIVLQSLYSKQAAQWSEHVTALVQSTSPDGMFRCTLTEWSGTMPRGGWGIQAKILVEKRSKQNLNLISSENGEELWNDVKREPIPVDDSACRSNYSIAWEYDGKHRTIGLTVFGDYGTPPYPGEIILRMPLAAEP